MFKCKAYILSRNAFEKILCEIQTEGDYEASCCSWVIVSLTLLFENLVCLAVARILVCFFRSAVDDTCWKFIGTCASNYHSTMLCSLKLIVHWHTSVKNYFIFGDRFFWINLCLKKILKAGRTRQLVSFVWLQRLTRLSNTHELLWDSILLLQSLSRFVRFSLTAYCELHLTLFQACPAHYSRASSSPRRRVSRSDLEPRRVPGPVWNFSLTPGSPIQTPCQLWAAMPTFCAHIRKRSVHLITVWPHDQVASVAILKFEVCDLKKDNWLQRV